MEHDEQPRARALLGRVRACCAGLYAGNRRCDRQLESRRRYAVNHVMAPARARSPCEEGCRDAEGEHHARPDSSRPRRDKSCATGRELLNVWYWRRKRKGKEAGEISLASLASAAWNEQIVINCPPAKASSKWVTTPQGPPTLPGHPSLPRPGSMRRARRAMLGPEALRACPQAVHSVQVVGRGIRHG